ncbi:fructose-6-phosphate aldolase [Aerococcus urinaeequi]|uniref:fructose-6-phosphate aldolase n=1 Tax=Aerococcus urinaeequi TaxID=51665 RepID=UPI000846072A|nr:fructose-6-phosphate aldolase [Aerococcus urinaeequi]
MKLVLDTANINKIEEYLTYLPVVGVTTNPSILKKEGKFNFEEHMLKIRNIIGNDMPLHIQTIQTDYEGIIKDAHRIYDLFDDNVYIKIPVSKEGLAAIKTLKEEGFKITATAIYSEIQALLAMGFEVNYLAPYVNRMSNIGTDPFQLISNVNKVIVESNSKTNILGASFKNIDQVLKAVQAGSKYVTVGDDVLNLFLGDANILKAVTDFGNDWYTNFETNEI